MKLSYKTRRFLSAIVLLIGLPLYIVLCVTLIDLIERPHFGIEFLIYVALGILWALPLKFIFKGIGQAEEVETKARADESD